MDLLKIIGCMYVTLVPVILAGILNMIWVKLPVLKFLSKPVDFGKDFVDGKRIFGDNKTWKGIAGYLLFNTVFTLLWGLILRGSALEKWDFFYITHDNTFSYNLLVGVLLGLGYSLFELPNSFLKRRFDIKPGKSVSGLTKVFFIFLDQADSIFGVALVVWLLYDLGVLLYLLYVLIGAATHLILNMLLYFMKLRKNMF